MISDELKCCPFCGGEAETITAWNSMWRKDMYRIACSNKACPIDYIVTKQHATEAEAIAAWNARANDSLQPESVVSMPTIDGNDGTVALAGNHLRDATETMDSRERLEADVRNQAEYSWVAAPHWKVIDWLDRQAAITSRERCYSHDALEEELERVRAERDELKAEIAKYEHDWGLLLDEKRKLTAERDALRDIIAHMPKTEQECEACQDAHDRLMFNAKVHQDELRDELKHKQLVIDRQRDSFAKMEREYRELQDVCGELERTVENLRGD